MIMNDTNIEKIADLIYQTVTGTKQVNSKIATIEEIQELLYQIAIDPKSTKREVAKAKAVYAKTLKK